MLIGKLVTGILAIALVSGCAARTQSHIEGISAQLERGESIYYRDCATELCHGAVGEGLRQGDTYKVWPLVGKEFQERNPNAQVVFDVVRSGSEANLRLLSDQEIYDSIAYELSQNGVELEALLTAENAAEIASGPASPQAGWGTLYPPPGNAILIAAPPAPGVSPMAETGYLRLRVDQLAHASQIGKSPPPEGGYFLILVLAFEDLSQGELALDPKNLKLYDATGQAYAPQAVRLAYPIELFHPQTITPEHGTAAVVIFALPEGADYARLVYDDPTGQPLSIPLS